MNSNRLRAMRSLWQRFIQFLKTTKAQWTCDHDMQPVDGKWEHQCTKCTMQSSVIR